MKTLYFALPVLSLFLIGIGRRAEAQVITRDGKKSNVASVEPELYAFKSQTLEGRVKEAIEQGKQNDDGPILQLMGQYEKDPDKVLVLLKPYLDDPDPDVQFTIIGAVAGESDSKEALLLLTHYVTNKVTGQQAVTLIYNDYTRKQIIDKGGKRLKAIVLQSAVTNPYSVESYLILSCYKENPRILSFLQKRRESFNVIEQVSSGKNKYRMEKISGELTDRTSGLVALDLSLAELGDYEALKRVRNLLHLKQSKEVSVLLRHLKFVNNTTVLSGAIDQLKNRAVAQEVRSFDGKVIDYSRVCDEAMKDLRLRFDPPQKQSYDPPRRFTDAELLAAYKKYSALIASKAENSPNTNHLNIAPAPQSAETSRPQ